MMNVSQLRWLMLAIGCCLGGFAPARGVIISLSPQSVAVKQSTVRVGDVADIIGGTQTQQRLIADLDLESLADRDRCQIDKSQVVTRLLLSGLDRDDFQVTGPEAVIARRISPARIRDHLTRQVTTDLATQFGVDANHISLRLADDDTLAKIESTFPEANFAAEVIPPNEFPIGRSRLGVQLVDRNGRRLRSELDCQVGLTMRVAIVTQPVARGSVIRPEMIRVVEREIIDEADYANTNEVVGRAASRYIPSNSILLARHLMPTRGRAAQVVRRNDLIDVVVNVGNGQIRLKNAQALESGAAGDVIEVLNPNSGRRINASIVGPNLATIGPSTRRQ
jgi:flagella basal body P-ring formation protein FlgA